MQSISGKVVKGKSRGKALGFPTANIPVGKSIEEGIYLAKVTVPSVIPAEAGDASGKLVPGGQIQKKPGSPIRSGMTRKGITYPALTFIGKAITFGETKLQAESYLLGFSGDLYGKEITINLLQKIRDNKKFNSQEELVAQMQKDLIVARKFFIPWC